MIFGTVYKITNLITGKIYVGQTIRSLHIRFNAHCTDKRKDTAIAQAIRKYGKQNFKIEELATATNAEELNKLETHYIETLNSLSPNGYNLNLGGNKSYVISKETLKKLSDSHKGIPNKHKGVPLSLEHKYKLSIGKVIGVNIKTKECYLFAYTTQVEQMGFKPFSVGAVLRKEKKQLKGWVFFFESEYISHANQSGRSEIKSSDHTQRLASEPIKIEYNEAMSPLIPKSYRRQCSLDEIVDAINKTGSQVEAAKYLNITVGSIRNRIFKARKKGIKVNLNS